MSTATSLLRRPWGQLHYGTYTTDDPEGSAVILIHGLGSCGEDWGLQIRPLQVHHHVFTPDLCGHGRSTAPAGWPRVGDHAADIAALAEDRALQSAHLVGLSLGGLVALQLAISRPDLVRSLCLVNSYAKLRVPRGRRRRTAARLYHVLRGDMQAMARMIAQGLFPEEHQRQLRELASARLAANDRSAYLKSLWAAIRYDGRDRLGELKCPTLVVAGERDRTIAMQAKRELAGGIPGAALEILAGSGHATPLDAAPRFNALLSAHLNSVDR